MPTRRKHLAQSKNCLACHAVDKKLVGPAYTEVAKKYKGNKDAEAMLIKKVINGGGGVWGTIPMPPNPVKEDEAKTPGRVDLVPVIASSQLQPGKAGNAPAFLFLARSVPCTT